MDELGDCDVESVHDGLLLLLRVAVDSCFLCLANSNDLVEESIA